MELFKTLTACYFANMEANELSFPGYFDLKGLRGFGMI
jgi:hypothetical protein